MAWLDSALDRSIVFSFDRTGYARHARTFRDDARDLRGREVLVTGGTRGIGRAITERLAARGARVTVWGRTDADARATASALGLPEPVVGDLGDLEAAGRVVAGFVAAGRRFDALVLNAGAMPLTRTLTPQGHELTWASQVLGHWLLVRGLRDAGLLDGARVVWMASGGLYMQRLDLRDLTWSRRRYQRHTAYANAKRAQTLLTERLQRESGHRLWVGVTHPGWVDTGAVALSMPLFHRLTGPILRTPAQGADTAAWMVETAAALPGGRFWFDRAEVPFHLRRDTVTRAGDAEKLDAVVDAAVGPFLPGAGGRGVAGSGA